MRKLVLYQLLSLDGVAEEPSDWFFDDGPEVFDNLARVIETQDDILLGRGTYDYWVGYWPTADVEPFASFVNGTRKHLVTSSAPTAPWANTTVVTTPVADYVTEMKHRAGGDIGIHGSIGLARSLVYAGLVDELRLVVAPALAGHGRRLFGGDDGALQALDLVDVQRSPQGTLFLTYERRPPAA
ncbi:MAG TPA: dihydrofolate reductase family protein [Acidimicrobiales bacterium]